MNLIYSAIMAISFFTIIPMPLVDWTEKRMKYVPLMMPLIGIIIAIMGYGMTGFLLHFEFSPLFNAVIMTLYFLIITGGIHIDGLMDTADAYFSRQDIEKKLEIMKDSRVGAFGVIALVSILMLKTVFFYEIFLIEEFNITIIFLIPILSRIFQPSMLYLFPSAKNDGLAKMYSGGLKKSHVNFLLLIFLGICAFFILLTGLKPVLTIVSISLFYYVFFYFSTKKQFGGITGDLLGAYLEISELLMLGTIIFIR